MSPQITVDWDGIASGEAVPEGRYSARVDKVEERTSEAGNIYWNIEFVVQDEGASFGRHLWDVFMLQPQSLWKLKRLAQCIAIDVKARTGMFDSDELVGQEVGVVVGQEVYEGQVRTRVKGYFPLT